MSMTRNWHDLIFSNQPGLRRQRHILFWIVWLIYFTGSFFYEQQGFAAAGSWKWIFIILVQVRVSPSMPHVHRIYGDLFSDAAIRFKRPAVTVLPGYTDRHFNHHRMGLFLLCDTLSQF